MGTDQPQEERQAPVPLEKHYEVFKRVEDDIKSQLSELDYDLLLVGLRVGYDTVSDNENPYPFPYTVEFGYVETLDCALEHDEEELNETEWLEATQGELSRHPMPIEYLDRIYEQTKAQLEESAGSTLDIGVDIVLYGSPLKGYSIGCLCKKGGNRRRKYCYYDKKLQKTKCYCSSRAC